MALVAARWSPHRNSTSSKKEKLKKDTLETHCIRFYELRHMTPEQQEQESQSEPSLLGDFKELFDMVKKAENVRGEERTGTLEDDEITHPHPEESQEDELARLVPETPGEGPGNTGTQTVPGNVEDGKQPSEETPPDERPLEEQVEEGPDEARGSPQGSGDSEDHEEAAPSAEELPPTTIEDEMEGLEREIDEELKKERRERKLTWHASDYGMLGFTIFSFVYLFVYFWEKNSDTILMGIFFGIIAGTGIVSGIIARLSATRTFPFLEVIARQMKGNFEFAIIRSPYSRPGTLTDHLVSALRWCLFPTLAVFFLLSYVAEMFPAGKALVGEEMNLFHVFLFLLPAFGMALVAPLRILANSSLMRYNVQERIIEPFGNALSRLLRAVGGMGALAAFLKVALKRTGIMLALQDTFMILMFVLPTMFIATLVYSFWHLGFVRKLDGLWERMGYQEYRLGHKYPSSTLEIQVLSEEEVTLARKRASRGHLSSTFAPPDDHFEAAGANQEEEADDCRSSKDSEEGSKTPALPPTATSSGDTEDAWDEDDPSDSVTGTDQEVTGGPAPDPVSEGPDEEKGFLDSLQDEGEEESAPGTDHPDPPQEESEKTPLSSKELEEGIEKLLNSPLYAPAKNEEEDAVLSKDEEEDDEEDEIEEILGKKF